MVLGTAIFKAQSHTTSRIIKSQLSDPVIVLFI